MDVLFKFAFNKPDTSHVTTKKCVKISIAGGYMQRYIACFKYMKENFGTSFTPFDFKDYPDNC